ncbi:XRE family transcriptional regulator [Pseudocolwellia sp. AS88]|uniref:helix-turn-helix domain-containing protein n=1 Tax=Pseudocolwellia sp. AS88 TaxID=3063958 RepID=UPI0026F1B819|nr:XRE family transcriptional regulator [Pseudocolwellia sp. AS88]MDO7086193.1 XRE family transcriptional regulator [Pseudocolwellia sp. AS88]
MGLQLKSARSNKGWSLDTTSKNTGVSKAMLGQIERGESSPTVSKLWEIANGFALPLTYFFGELESNNVEPKKLITEKSIAVSTLFSFDPATKSEILLLTLEPAHQHISVPHSKGVIEHLIVIDGEMEYFINNQWHHLKQGEFVKFNADVEHGYRNLSAKTATFHNVIFYTDEGKKNT